MYTTKTDVWSAAATIYVLVAGYVSHCLKSNPYSLETYALTYVPCPLAL